jgi:DNA-binding transcriptional ArsR family regulator
MTVDFAAIGRLLASDARSTMLDALLDGRALTAGELARVAGIAPATASGHLAALVDGGLIAVRPQGRHRYVELAGPDVAGALESLSRICPKRRVRSLRQSATAARLAAARTCYDHLAGRLGVALMDVMVVGRWLLPDVDGWIVSDIGAARLSELGVDVEAARTERRRFATSCLDWTEHRAHLAGALGAAIATRALTARWVRRPDAGRGLLVTAAGRHQFSTIGVDPAVLR